MILPKPRRFTLRARLEPAGVFGVPETGVLVFPSPADGVTVDQTLPPSTGADMGQSRPAVPPFEFSTEIAEITIRVTGNVAHLEAKGMKAQIVFTRVTSVLRHLLRMLSVHLAITITGQVESFIDEENGPVELPTSNVVTINYYDLPSLTQAFSWSREAIECGDVSYQRAVQYFLAGCSCYGAWEAHQQSRVSPSTRLEDDSDDSIWTSAFLHFWKAITVILSEPSENQKRDRLFAERCKTLSLAPQDVALIRLLKEIRDDFDVAHRSEDEFDQGIPRMNVTVIQETAQSVIFAYLGTLKRTERGLGPSDEGLVRRRQERERTIQRVRQPKSSRVRRLVVGRTTRSSSVEVSHYPGRDIITWSFPAPPRDSVRDADQSGADSKSEGPADS